MGKGFDGVLLAAMGAQPQIAEVTGVTRINERMVRVHLHSDTVLHPEGEKPGDWVRGWFPDKDHPRKLFQRGYTIINSDPGAGTFDIDFVQHHPLGPAARWAITCEPGDLIELTRYSGQLFEYENHDPAGYLFLGDLTSYPAITALLEALPEGATAVAYLVARDPLDETMPLPQGPHITARWVPELPDGQSLATTLEGRDFSGWFAWVCSESKETRYAKTTLTQRHHLTRSDLHSQAYWVAGRAMGTDTELDSAAVAAAHRAAEETQQAEAPVAQEDQEVTVLAPAKLPLILAGIAQGAVSILQLVPFLLFIEMARLFLVGAERAAFEGTAIAALIVLAVSTLAASTLVALMHLYEAGFSAAVRRRLVAKLGRLPLGWFRSRDSGEVRTLVSDDVASLHYLVVHAVLDLVGAVVTPLAALIYLFTVDWKLALVLLIPVIAYVATMLRIATRDRPNMITMQRYQGQLAGEARHYLASQDTIRIFGDRAIGDLTGSLAKMGDFLSDWQLQTSPAKITSTLLNRPFTTLAVVLGAGWLFIAAGWTRPEQLLPFLILGTSFGGQLVGISHATGGLISGLAARDSIETLLSTRELTHMENHIERGTAPTGAIRFDSVDFGYVPESRVLQNFSVEIAPGTTTALVGASGSGKSTIVALIARLWDPQSGTVAVDGRDLRNLSAEELYSQVSVLLQDVHLIDATVAENIALAAPGATAEQIRRAAGTAHIAAEIEALERGYDTHVTDSSLSGGQRQRIGIARALLHDAPILVLDEATAAADADTEWAIRQGLRELVKGKTVIMIAHRLHTIRHADRILVIEDGRIIQDGTHAELSDSPGAYAELWQAVERSV